MRDLSKKESRIEKLIKFYEKAKVLLSDKKFERGLTMLATIVVFMTVFNGVAVYAQTGDDSAEDTKIDTLGTWEAETKMNEYLSGTENANIFSTSQNELLSRSLGIVYTLEPCLSDNCEDIMADSSIPDYTKKGLYSIVYDNVNTVVYNPPTINIAQHMATEWVPGYDTTQYSTFAADGYDYLQSLGIDQLWVITRNIAYVLFVVIMIITGFMIMFRQKIGGQVAITVFNSIPNIIIGLLLVTFSFAIVGIVLNFAVMLQDVVLAIFYGGDATQAIFPSNFFSLITFGDSNEFIENVKGVAQVGIAPAAILGIVGLLSGTLGAATIVLSITMVIIVLIVLVLYIWAGIRVWFTLFKTFISIIFQTIMGPLLLTFGSLPGQSARQLKWFLNIVKSALVFPIVFFFVNLPNYLSIKGIIFDPTGVINGDFVLPTGAKVIEAVATVVLPLILYFFAADAPKMLDDLIPADGSKGVQAALAGTLGSLKKIPVIGSFIG